MQEKTTWLFELKDLSDDDFRHLQKKMDKMGHEIKDIENRDAFSASRKGAGKFKDQLTDIRHEIPLLDRGLTLLSSPLGMAAAAATGLGIVLHKANKAAKEFNFQFLELKNLNLDKTEAQIERLKDKVLSTAFDGGLNSTKTAQAFLDVQSTTGAYGREVERIVSKAGKFSIATQSDLNTNVEGVAKAMEIYGFGANELDRFFQSSAKAVDLGVVSFADLAKVQTEFAGAAFAANQGFEEANNLFSVFTKSQKNYNIAANVTKTALQDLTKASTIKGFGAIGVDLFDVNDQMRGLEDILIDLVPELQGMTDLRFSKFKEDVGGSEGMIALLDQLKIAGDDVLETFRADSNFNIDEALKNAKEDAETLSQILDNKINNSFIRMGDNLQPVLNSLKEFTLRTIDGFDKYVKSFNAFYNKDFHKKSKFDERKNEIYESRIDAFNDSESVDWYNNLPKDKQKKYIEDLEADNEFQKFMLHPKSKDRYSQDKLAEAAGRLQANKEMIDLLTNNSKTSPSSTADGISGDKDKTAITGIEAVNKMRNVTVNINSLVQELRYYTEESGMSDQDIEQKIVELLVRAVHDAELALG